MKLEADACCTCTDGPYRVQPDGFDYYFCEVCGAGVLGHDEARDARDVELLRRALSPQLAAGLRPAAAPPATGDGAPAGKLLTPREVAERLRLDRVKTLPKLLNAGVLHAVPWGGRGGRRFDAAEVDALAVRGLADVPGVGRRPPPRTAGEARRAARGNAAPEAISTPSRARRSRGGAATARAIRALPLTPKAER